MASGFDSDEEPPLLIQTDASDAPVAPPQNTAGSNNTNNKVPLTIICGFLGAGKSTLLKRILTEKHGYRIAVIMNEFGDTADIEAKTINVASAEDPSGQSEEFLELANGCLCCSIKDTGVAAIEKLMLKKGLFDYILLETTGLADPGPIASMFWLNEEYATGLADIVLDSVLCVVDGVFGKQQIEEDHDPDADDLKAGESIRQIAGSDVIMINKVDLTPSSQVTELEETVRAVNPVAPIYKTIRGEIDLKHILNIGAYKRPQPELFVGEDGTSSTPAHVHSDACDHDHEKTEEDRAKTHYEVRGISSLQVKCGVLTKPQIDALDIWIRAVLWENRLPNAPQTKSLQVLRCKGAFTTTEGVHYVLQGVRSMYELCELEGGVTGEEGDRVDVPDTGKLVLIGKGLDEEVRKSLEAVLTGSLASG